MVITRRSMLGWGTVLTAGASFGFTGLCARAPEATGTAGLIPDPKQVLDLPEGFTYHVVQLVGDRMSDGRRARPAPDGMAAFPGPDGATILMRNHELSDQRGGVSRVVVAPDLTVRHSNDVLTGTSRNCAGGPSPWGWLSCEEVERGGVWICPTDATTLLTGTDRVRIDGYGSFQHEAVAIDPDRLVAYLTEDNGESHLFRFVPSSPSTPFDGQLQAMTVPGRPRFPTNTLSPGASIDVGWVDVEPARARASAQAAGAAIVMRGEGIWWFEGTVTFTATTYGQILRYTPTSPTSGRLTVIADRIHGADNITVAPSGVLYVAEDNHTANHLRTVTPAGTVRPFAFNRLQPRDEFAGVCFAPDGRTLFVNLQGSGVTLAIRGPFT